MTQETGYLETDAHRWHFLKAGTGNRIVLMFPGYNTQCTIFSPLFSRLSSAFTCYSFDLPHHGPSTWETEAPILPAELTQLATTLMTRHQQQQCSLVGYSLGGRFCLKLATEIPRQIASIVLLAPDGLVRNPFYQLATRTLIGQQLFQRILKKPKKFLQFTDWLAARQWLPQSRALFIHRHLSNAADRERLRRVWLETKWMVNNPKQLKQIIRQHQLPTALFMGQQDPVIPIAQGIQFARGVSSVRLFALDKGHWLLDAGTIPQITDFLCNH